MTRPGRAVAVCAVAAIAVVLPAGAGQAKTIKKTFSSGNLNLAVPEPFDIFQPELTSRIKVKAEGRIKDVNVAVRITTPDGRDLDIDVYAPAIKVARLKDHGFLSDPKGPDFGAGPPTCRGTATVFDSQAAAPILQGAPPFLGSYVPVNSLTGFHRGPVNGKWKLTLTDNFVGTIDGMPGRATLNCWKVTVRYKPERRK
jgi:hypothetical protein